MIMDSVMSAGGAASNNNPLSEVHCEVAIEAAFFILLQQVLILSQETKKRTCTDRRNAQERSPA
jgi:hypothetical protein